MLHDLHCTALYCAVLDTVRRVYDSPLLVASSVSVSVSASASTAATAAVALNQVVNCCELPEVTTTSSRPLTLRSSYYTSLGCCYFAQCVLYCFVRVRYCCWARVHVGPVVVSRT